MSLPSGKSPPEISHACFFRCSAAAFKRLLSAGSSTPHLRSRQFLTVRHSFSARLGASAWILSVHILHCNAVASNFGVCWGLGDGGESVVIHLPMAILVLLDNDTPRHSVIHRRCYLMWKIPFTWQGCIWNILGRVSSSRCVSGNIRTGGSLG